MRGGGNFAIFNKDTQESLAPKVTFPTHKDTRESLAQKVNDDE